MVTTDGKYYGKIKFGQIAWAGGHSKLKASCDFKSCPLTGWPCSLLGTLPPRVTSGSYEATVSTKSTPGHEKPGIQSSPAWVDHNPLLHSENTLPHWPNRRIKWAVVGSTAHESLNVQCGLPCD